MAMELQPRPGIGEDHPRAGPSPARAASTVRGQVRPATGGLADVIRAMRWARLRVTMRAEEMLHLPPYKGSTFRGAFGHAFKRVACPLRRQCEGCAHRTVCVYVYVFETAGSSDDSAVARGSAVAHPFVVEPPETAQGEFRPGDTLTFGLILIGRAIPLAPYFLAACREMGRLGLGRGRGRCRLERAMADDPEEPAGRQVYDGERDLMAAAVPPWSMQDLEDGAAPVGDRVTLEFLTPTRLRRDADLVVRPDFATLATVLLRRVSVLAEVHCGHLPAINACEILAPAADVAVETSDLRWYDWERYSARQDARMALGGFVGRITFTGPLSPWWPLLKLGEILHVGKGTGFGLGKYRMVSVG